MPQLEAISKQVVKVLGAHWIGLDKAFREERAVADKPEFVDMISEATRQVRRRVTRHVIEPEPEKERWRLSHWPPDRWVQWRIETLTPWKLKSWKFRNWG